MAHSALCASAVLKTRVILLPVRYFSQLFSRDTPVASTQTRHRDIHSLWELGPVLLQASCQGQLKELTALRVKLG